MLSLWSSLYLSLIHIYVKVTGHHFTEAEAAFVEDTLLLNDAIVDVTFYTRSSQIAIKHTGDVDAVREAVLGLSLIHILKYGY